ncbi:MAG TPA: hypothetical protein VKE26_22715 [Xanthobacteraceae bacterium]|nr:hypothetical protein [Xanthobacteraceae bacterium]
MAEQVFGFVLRAVGRLAFEGVLYLTARIALPLFTFGWWRVKPLTDRRSNLSWFDMKRQPDGTMLIGLDLAILFGMLTWFLIGLVLLALLVLVR